MSEMTKLQDSVVPQICQEYEVNQKEFSYFMLQSLHTMKRTQALSENTFYKYKGERKPKFAQNQ